VAETLPVFSNFISWPNKSCYFSMQSLTPSVQAQCSLKKMVNDLPLFASELKSIRELLVVGISGDKRTRN